MQVKAELQAVLAQELSARKFSYPRTDGSQWTLSLKDVIDRVTDLEMAYNVNDCVELRWGAKDGSEEFATCKRKAPQGQRAKMTDYRPWFSERRQAVCTGRRPEAVVSDCGGTVTDLAGQPIEAISAGLFGDQHAMRHRVVASQ